MFWLQWKHTWKVYVQTMKRRTERNQRAWSNRTEGTLSSSTRFRPEMETAGGKYPPAKSCVMSLVKGMVEFITVCFSRPQRNEESSLRAQKIPQAMVLTAPTTSVWLSPPGPLKQLFHLWIPVVWSGRVIPYIQVSQKRGVIITILGHCPGS